MACRPTTIASTLIENPFLEQGESGIVHCYADSRIGQWTSLSAGDADPETLLARIDSSARRNVKKAEAEGIFVEIDCGQMDRLRQMHQDNMRAIGGLPKEDSFFTGVARHFQPGQDYEIYVAKRDGQIIAGLLVFYFNRAVEYFVPAVDHAYRSLQPSSLILITALAEAARRGFKRWNWGGTWETQIGLHRFKRKWAALERRYCYYTQLNDDSILSWSRPRILKTFPGFFVLPFFALKMEETNDG
jgi:lipid II:glycine glycyltransferase (peptidoglycan interpeptide bridge formation enzyme)